MGGGRGQVGGRRRNDRGVPAEPPAGGSGPDLHFINAFTDTIDLSALRRRLEMEDAPVPEQTEYIPRLYGRGRPEGDSASTQVVNRSGIPGGGWDARSGTAYAGLEAGAPARADRDRVVASRRGLPATAAAGGQFDEAAEYSADVRSGAPDAQDEAVGGGSTKSKAIWTLADQGVSSATNAAVSILIAHYVGKTEYGAFAIPYLIFSVIIGISRASCCVPLGIAYAGRSAREFRHAAGSTTGACLTFGALLSLPLILLGALFGGSVGTGILLMGFVLPGLLLQDAWRYVFFAQGRPANAFLNDIAWAAVQVIGLSLLIERGVTKSPPMLLAWGVSALIAALLGVAQAGLWPAPSRAFAWIRENRSNATNLTAEFITVQGALQASILLMGALHSAEIVGALNAVRTLLGPTTVIGVGIVSFAVPELSRRMDMSARARQRAAVVLSAIVVGLGLLWSLIFVLFPQVGEFLFKQNWPGAHAILLLSVLHYAGTAVPTGPACVMYALGKTRTTFRINLVMAPMLFTLPILGLLLGDAPGAVIGFNLVFWGIAPVWWILLRRVVREHEAARLAVPVGGSVTSGGRGAGDARGDDSRGGGTRGGGDVEAGRPGEAGGPAGTGPHGLGPDSGALTAGPDSRPGRAARGGGRHARDSGVRLHQTPVPEHPGSGGSPLATDTPPHTPMPPPPIGAPVPPVSGPQGSTWTQTEGGIVPER
ncbi:membrane protein involved in the export of O-antigen and teichoic acid [Frankia sp. EI5c]|nr:membrane protein involved in the export of O-antigen and teichoic acid [Frankia sp. EI5c]